jgi:putative ABC transport system permease protein
LVALATLLPYASAVSSSALPTGPIWIYLLIIAIAFTLTMLSTLIPATKTLTTRPAEAAARAD